MFCISIGIRYAMNSVSSECQCECGEYGECVFACVWHEYFLLSVVEQNESRLNFVFVFFFFCYRFLNATMIKKWLTIFCLNLLFLFLVAEHLRSHIHNL